MSRRADRRWRRRAAEPRRERALVLTTRRLTARRRRRSEPRHAHGAASTTGYYLGRIRIGGRAVTGLRPPGKLARLVAKSGTIWYPHARVNYEERELRKRYYPNRSVNRTGI